MKHAYRFETDDPWEVSFIATAIALACCHVGVGGRDPLDSAAAIDIAENQTMPMIRDNISDDKLMELTRTMARLVQAAMSDLKESRDARPDA